jgi:hypothetical protein
MADGKEIQGFLAGFVRLARNVIPVSRKVAYSGLLDATVQPSSLPRQIGAPRMAILKGASNG